MPRLWPRWPGRSDLPFVLGAWQPTRSGHFESDARRARYDWLTEVARVRGASVIAVGHTSDDQAETILHRIIRGTGPRGLAGIPSRRVLSSSPRLTLVRPLLGVSRQEVRDYLAALKQPFREDASNADLSRTRARIRHDLLPKLAAEYNPNVALALVRLGSLASSFEQAIEADLRELERSAVITQRTRLRRAQARLLAVDSGVSAGGSAAPGVAEGRLARGEHVGVAVAAAGGPG